MLKLKAHKDLYTQLHTKKGHTYSLLSADACRCPAHRSRYHTCSTHKRNLDTQHQRADQKGCTYTELLAAEAPWTLCVTNATSARIVAHHAAAVARYAQNTNATAAQPHTTERSKAPQHRSPNALACLLQCCMLLKHCSHADKKAARTSC